jgi:hypothetical protein
MHTGAALKARLFVLDWTPLVGLVVIYEALRDLVPIIGAPRRYLGWVDSDLFGGQLPGAWLQARFHQPRSVDWEDAAATAIYFVYYLVPVIVGLLWWFRSRSGYHRYAAALVVLCGLAFATYVAMPTVPPWLAQPQSIDEITDMTIAGLNLPAQLVAMYVGHDYNLYAAFPSLHAAFPVVLAYYGWLRSRLVGVTLAAYAGLVWVSIVFLGEHYLVDIAGAVVYALVAIGVVEAAARVRLPRSMPVESGSVS